MNYRAIIFIAYIIFMSTSSVCLADTTYVAAGNVGGVWNIDGSPYIVYNGDITLPANNSMTIMPGVEVFFTGNYKFIVQGLLHAEGTEEDSIIFTRRYPTEESKWRGFRFDNADDRSILAYCRIEWAKGTGPYPDVRGGGIWIENCSITVRHCLIANNYCHNENYNGSGGGAFVNASENTSFEHCSFVSNEADNGGGICVGQECFVYISHCVFTGNHTFSSGGGVYVSANGSSDITDCVFENNLASGGFGGGGLNLWSASWMYGTESQVYNNVFVNNTASSAGGGIYHRYESSNMYNNTIVNNTASMGGGVYVLTFSDLPPVYTNNIIWGNAASTGSQIYLDPAAGSVAQVNYNDVQGGWAGIGNINSDPLFVTGPYGEHYLSQIASGQGAQSSCVDSGDPNFPLIPGTTRTDGVPDEGIIDMGVHYMTETTVGELTVTLAPQGAPIIIPAGGGSFLFDLEIANVGSTAAVFDAWSEVQLPNGSIYGPIILRTNLTLEPGSSVIRNNMTQVVPGNAPSGTYFYIVNVGEHPGSVSATHQFGFEKLGQ